MSTFINADEEAAYRDRRNGHDGIADELEARAWPEPEDRGTAVLSALGHLEYVEDLIRPGRIVVWAAEEGAGKSYTVAGELGIRFAVAGGSLAGTWTVRANGGVLVLSEMHSDDDYTREDAITVALGIDRAALTGRYFRLPLMTAAGGPPALTVAAWREWVTGWMREHGTLLLIVDTATGATQVDPWGKAIQAVYADLRAMLEAYPELAIVLVIHLKKPTGRGGRRISDVMGEWGRWNDVTVIQEADGIARTKLATYKRVRHQRRITATRADGLLVDPVDTDAAKGSKVPTDAVLAAVNDHPGGLTWAELGELLGVSGDTAQRYANKLGDAVVIVRGTNNRPGKVYPAPDGVRSETDPAPQRSAGAGYGPDAERQPPPEPARSARSAPTRKGAEAYAERGEGPEIADADPSGMHLDAAETWRAIDNRGGLLA